MKLATKPHSTGRNCTHYHAATASLIVTSEVEIEVAEMADGLWGWCASIPGVAAQTGTATSHDLAIREGERVSRELMLGYANIIRGLSNLRIVDVL